MDTAILTKHIKYCFLQLPGLGQAGPSFAPAPFQPPTAAQAAEAALRGDLPAIPGFAHPSASTAADVDAFLSQYGGPQAGPAHDMAREFENIYAAGMQQQHGPAMLHSSGARSAVRPFLEAFLHSGTSAAAGFDILPLPPGAVELTISDKCRVRDRSTILARQVFADRGTEFADQQVGRLLRSLNIDPAALPAEVGQANGGWDAIYRGAGTAMVAGEHAAAAAAAAHATNKAYAGGISAPNALWVEEFGAMNLNQATPSEAWAQEFSAGASPAVAQSAGSDWADEFRTAADAGTALRQRADGATAMEQTRKLADTLASNSDPKFQNSKFLQFVSKMSRGELILEDNAVKEVPAAAARWADEFSTQQQQQAAGPSVWGEEFASFQASQHPGAAWAQEFGVERGLQGAGDTSADWADQFAQGVAGGDWAEQFAGAENAGPDVAAWEEEYLQELQNLHLDMGLGRIPGEYIMAENNPFLADTDSFSKGKDLFRRGVLSEAVLALEAECQRNPQNSEAWRLLGTVQAENDDDVQAIAALNKALAADPDDLDALLSLGVSHTNELEQSEALNNLRQWVMRHPVHGTAARQVPGPPDSSQAIAYVISLYEGAAAAAPQDADVHAALGVLCNLARRYDGAVNAFRAALKLRPQDYSLWNKLGATLANSARSSEALAAYQKALELKPNYMRAWTNMGISLANIGDYEGSARYYVRALALNRRATAVWGYLRTSLSCAAREDLMAAADAEDIDSLLQSLPL